MSSTLTTVSFKDLPSTGPPVSGFDKAVAGILPKIWDGIVWVSKKLGLKNKGGLVAPEGMHYMPDGRLMKDSEHFKPIQHFGKRGSFQR